MEILAPFLGMGIVIILIGLVVWKTPVLKAIAGPTSKRDYKGLSKWAGKNAIMIGIIVIIASLVAFFITGAPNGFINLVIILILGLRMSRGMNRF